MLDILILLFSGLIAGFRSRLALQTEILALRYQIIVLMRSDNRTKLQAWDRFVWIGLLRFWPQWRSVLIIVKSEAALAWHRKGFRLLWTWKCRHGKSGRPKIPREVRDLIPTMGKNNSLWGAPRIHGELLKLGINVSQATVAKYMTHHPKLPSQTWRTFLINHSKQLASIDFFTVPTISFRVLRKTPQLRDKYTDVLAKLLSMTFLSTLFGGFYLILESPASARYSPKQREIRSNEVF